VGKICQLALGGRQFKDLSRKAKFPKLRFSCACQAPMGPPWKAAYPLEMQPLTSQSSLFPSSPIRAYNVRSSSGRRTLAGPPDLPTNAPGPPPSKGLVVPWSLAKIRRNGLSIRWSIVACCPLDFPSAGLPPDYLNPNHLVGRQSCATKLRQHFPRFDGHEHLSTVAPAPLCELYIGFQWFLT